MVIVAVKIAVVSAVIAIAPTIIAIAAAAITVRNRWADRAGQAAGGRTQTGATEVGRGSGVGGDQASSCCIGEGSSQGTGNQVGWETTQVNVMQVINESER